MSEPAVKWIGEIGYDEKFGARPLARVIQEHIKKPLADELLFGKLQDGGVAKVTLEGEGFERKLAFELIPADPAKKPKPSEDDDEDSGGEGAQAALAEASPRKALPGPKDRKPPRPGGGAVPSVPRKRDE
jgi:ATPases with chaperone activity, ATP-binding subunit